MSNEVFTHVQIDGVEYALAENAEGDHYVLSDQPARPPNAQVVQGTPGLFQLRPDMLQWDLTDWSGGMGQLKWDPENPNRWLTLYGFDVFSQPGELRRGFRLVALENNVGAIRIFDHEAVAWVIPDNIEVEYRLYSATSYFSYPNSSATGPAAGTAVTGLDDATDICGLAYDGTNTYFTQEGNNTLYRATNAAPQTAIVVETGAVLPTGATQLTELGPYVYVALNGIVYEKAKSGAGTVTIILDTEVDDVDVEDLVTMDGKVYFMVTNVSSTIIYEITPSTSAGPGFGRLMTSLVGFRLQGMHAFGGLLYLNGNQDAGIGGSSTISLPLMYLNPAGQGSVGTLGTMPIDLVQMEWTNMDYRTHTVAAGTLTHYFGLFARLNLEADQVPSSAPSTLRDFNPMLVEVDGISGGFAVVAAGDANNNDNDGGKVIEMFPTAPRSQIIQSWDGTQSTFFIIENNQFGHASSDPSGLMGMAISPFNSFGVAADKILSALELDCSTITGAEEIHIDVQLGPDATWQDDVAVFTASSTSFYVPLSQSASTPLLFTSLRIRIRVYYKATPDDDNVVIRGISLFAQIPKSVRQWDLLVDIGNDNSTKPLGKTRADALKTAKGKAVVTFIDRYTGDNQVAAEATAYVTVDELTIRMAKPGEGLAQVRLREIG